MYQTNQNKTRTFFPQAAPAKSGAAGGWEQATDKLVAVAAKRPDQRLAVAA